MFKKMPVGLVPLVRTASQRLSHKQVVWIRATVRSVRYDLGEATLRHPSLCGFDDLTVDLDDLFVQAEGG